MTVHRCDVTDEASVVAAYGDLDGPPSVLVNNAGGGRVGRSGAAICNTASIAGQTPGRLFAYGAAKAALIHWTRSMANELAPRKVRVNAVAPGIIRTSLWERMQPDEAAYDAMIDDTMPMGEDQKPSDIADAVAFLCPDRSSQVTGEVIRIDGGLTLR